MRKGIIKAAPLIVLLAGCTSSFQYSKYGTTEVQRNKDGYECRKEATYQASQAQVNQYGGTASSGNTVDMQMAAACLRARGYTVVWD